ncbi:hypothetical protein [Atlantibacter sp.]|uniref:hypothetical protein n=1 Tax=Atlantibacter sp. TaxID=1903473 RepID=UPI0028AB101C|nr:hypothetical protein [Atlantibacter sp.]
MEGQLVFCADGILRFCSDYDDTAAVPLLSIQNTVAEADPYFLLRYFHHRVIVEQGTTLASVFLAIEPWKALLTAWLDRDVGAYIDEIKKPSSSASWDLEWVGIDRRTSIYRAYQHQSREEAESLQDYFNREQTPSHEFDIETQCDASGFIKGSKERWSISENIHQIKNLPVILYDKQTLITVGKEGLLNDSVSGVNNALHSRYISGETSFSFADVMEAIFISGLFFYSPQSATENYQALDERLDAFKEQWESEPDNTADEENGNKTPTIQVADGAFDSMVDHIESEKEDWHLLKTLCKQNSSLPVRIGKIMPATPPEVRLFGELIDEEM